jgi:hypothetical protein
VRTAVVFTLGALAAALCRRIAGSSSRASGDFLPVRLSMAAVSPGDAQKRLEAARFANQLLRGAGDQEECG